MNLETLSSGDTNKKQILVEETDSTNTKRQNVTNKTCCGEFLEPGKKIQLDLFGQELLDAENHCNKLKAELQQFRRELPLLSQSVDASLESITSFQSECIHKEYLPVKDLEERQSNVTKVQPTRQISPYISTDNSGAAVVTINNILSGITESVNRLSHLHAHFESDLKSSNEKNDKSNVKDTGIKENGLSRTYFNFLMNQQEGSCPSLIEEIPVCSPEVKMKPKEIPEKKKNKDRQRIISNKLPDSSQTIQAANNKVVKVTAKRVDKKAKLRTVKTSMILNECASTATTKRRKVGRTLTATTRDSRGFTESSGSNNVLKNTTTKLVELYHNKEVKNSDSDDEEDKNKKKKSRSDKLQQQKVEDKVVPPLEINYEKHHYKSAKQLTEIEKETDYQEPATPRTPNSFLSKSYELPTIASKLKKVAKCYLQAFNFHMIPFCPAMSTSPSHNIGINIQQVLNIIKTRQPVCSISPTLAHNIGLAAEKLSGQPLHALVSTLSSRMTYEKSQCPLLKNSLNYQQLQEMAKEIPEEDGVLEEEVVNGNGKQVDDIPAYEEPTKDIPLQPGKQASVMWSVNQNRQLCSCVSKPGTGLKKILTKYSNTNNASNCSYSDYHVSHQQEISNFTPASTSFLKPRYTKANTLKLKLRTKEQNWMKPTKSASLPQSTTLCETARKRKNLKEVLQNLHDEFDTLNKNYEALSRRIGDNKAEGNDNNSALKELEDIEKELTKKEEEINMVVALYKEVAALKEQVKTLKKKASQSSIALNKPLQIATSSKTALHLTKLLRQIQHIHSHCIKAKT